jgi:hypothetical protein
LFQWQFHLSDDLALGIVEATFHRDFPVRHYFLRAISFLLNFAEQIIITTFHLISSR